jgi:hypothetical protein
MRFAILSLCLVGCSAANEPSAELSALGISRVDVAETSDRLSITGLDDAGATIASLDLELGRFRMLEDDREVAGRRMHVIVHGRSTIHESEGFGALALPAPLDAATGRFLTDPAVADPIARWGITVVAGAAAAPESALPGETPYVYPCEAGSLHWQMSGYTSCQASTYSGCASSQKRRFNKGSEWGEWRFCEDSPYGPAIFERACTGPGQQTSCGTAGPGGCAVCWVQAPVTNHLVTGTPHCTVTGSGGQCRWEACMWP